MGDRYVKSDEKKRLYFDSNNLYCWAMSEFLSYDETEIDKKMSN